MAESTTSCIENSGAPASARLPTIGKAKGDCIFCGHPLRYTLVDLGLSPLCENWLSEQDLHKPETYYPGRTIKTRWGAIRNRNRHERPHVGTTHPPLHQNR